MIVHPKLPLQADVTCVPAKETNGLWSTPLNQVTVGSNIRRARIGRRLNASRRLERQRRGEVLVHGFVDITSKWYTGYHTSAGTKRSSASDLFVDANSDADSEEPYDSEVFAAVGDSDDEPPNKLSEEMREQVEMFLNLQKAADEL